MNNIISAAIALIVAYVIFKLLLWLLAITFHLFLFLVVIVIAVPIFFVVQKKLFKSQKYIGK